MTRPLPTNVDEMIGEVIRLRALIAAYARAHRAHYRVETSREPDRGPRITRAEYLAAERALLEEGERV